MLLCPQTCTMNAVQVADIVIHVLYMYNVN